MTDLDKMSRELLAQWHIDRGLSEKVAQDCRDGAIDIPEIYWDLIRAALLTAPTGWKLVPVDPTPGMLGAAFNAPCIGHPETSGQSYSSIFRAMIAAAPEVKS